MTSSHRSVPRPGEGISVRGDRGALAPRMSDVMSDVEGLRACPFCCHFHCERERGGVKF